MSDEAQREITLDEYVEHLPKNCRVRKEYEQLKEDSIFLEYLRGAGVDNWDGFDFAMESLREANETLQNAKDEEVRAAELDEGKKRFDVV